MNLIAVGLITQMNSIGMSLAHINPGSIVNKKQSFQQYILDHNIDDRNVDQKGWHWHDNKKDSNSSI